MGSSSFSVGNSAGGLFGSTTNTTQTGSSNNSGIFGNQPQVSGVSSGSSFGLGFGGSTSNTSQPTLFGSSATTTTPASSGLFGTSSSAQPASQFGIGSSSNSTTGVDLF